MPEQTRTNTEERPLNGTQTLILVILCFIFPPLPVFLLTENSLYTRELLLSVLLTILGHVPGVLFSLYFILVEYPKRHGYYCCSQGYIRIEDHENSDPESRPMESERSHQQEANYTEPVASSEAPQSSTTAGSTSHDLNTEPPRYEDIASNNPFKPDVKPDNKVQH